MQNTLIISTGGTFNKIYNPLNGELIIDKSSEAVKRIAKLWLCKLHTISIIGKDSLEMTEEDRELLYQTIIDSDYERIVIIHGTDTMDVTAKYLAKKIVNRKVVNKSIVLTGAMVPYSIDPIEATANLCSALGYVKMLESHDIYIVMNGVFDRYDKVKKNRDVGKFI